MTVGYFARKREWPLESIALIGPLNVDQRQELLKIAERCPVHRTLTSKIDIRTSLVDPV